MENSGHCLVEMNLCSAAMTSGTPATIKIQLRFRHYWMSLEALQAALNEISLNNRSLQVNNDALQATTIHFSSAMVIAGQQRPLQASNDPLQHKNVLLQINNTSLQPTRQIKQA
jgi:hypothetical protein